LCVFLPQNLLEPRCILGPGNGAQGIVPHPVLVLLNRAGNPVPLALPVCSLN
jgi:hypothetical protein